VQNPHQYLTLGEVEELKDFEVVELGSESRDRKLLHWPQGSRATKEDQKNAELKDRFCVFKQKLL
jgi:hypothetical protein